MTRKPLLKQREATKCVHIPEPIHEIEPSVILDYDFRSRKGSIANLATIQPQTPYKTKSTSQDHQLAFEYDVLNETMKSAIDH